MSLDFHPIKEDLICSCDGDGEIRYWSINNGSCARVFKGGTAQMRFQPRLGRYLAAAAENVVSILDAETQACRHSLQAFGFHKGIPSQPLVHPDYQLSRLLDTTVFSAELREHGVAPIPPIGDFYANLDGVPVLRRTLAGQFTTLAPGLDYEYILTHSGSHTCFSRSNMINSLVVSERMDLISL